MEVLLSVNLHKLIVDVPAADGGIARLGILSPPPFLCKNWQNNPKRGPHCHIMAMAVHVPPCCTDLEEPP